LDSAMFPVFRRSCRRRPGEVPFAQWLPQRKHTNTSDLSSTQVWKTVEPNTWPRDVGDLFFGNSTLSHDQIAPTSSHAGRFYQRSLPSAQVPFSSFQGRQLFQEALLGGTLESYFFLAEQFRTQDEPTFCGLSTLAMVLNSLRIDPMRTWKGVWRWFNEQNLGCCMGPDEVREAGLNFDMFRCLASCNGADVVAHRSPAAHEGEAAKAEFVEDFRAAVQAVSRSKDRECMVICYCREALGQSGAGHFSPIGGYHEGSDAVLILDVARFKYPPHWAPLADVAEAMSRVDPDTKKPRGFLQLRLLHSPGPEGPNAMTVPLHLPYVPPAAGKRLSKALIAGLQADTSGDFPCMKADCKEIAPNSVAILQRWLSAVVFAEPQVLGQLLHVGDVAALQEVLGRLSNFEIFRQLCDAYALLIGGWFGGVPGEFPLLWFSKELPGSAATGASGGHGHIVASNSVNPWPGTCGELWVLLLLLLPEHLRVAVSPKLGGPWVAEGIARAVRGPWALPLEALREALSQILVPPLSSQECSKEAARSKS